MKPRLQPSPVLAAAWQCLASSLSIPLNPSLVRAGQRRKRNTELQWRIKLQKDQGAFDNSSVTHVGPTADYWGLESATDPTDQQGEALTGVSTTGKRRWSMASSTFLGSSQHHREVMPGHQSWLCRCSSILSIPFPFAFLSELFFFSDSVLYFPLAHLVSIAPFHLTASTTRAQIDLLFPKQRCHFGDTQGQVAGYEGCWITFSQSPGLSLSRLHTHTVFSERQRVLRL